MSFSIFIGWFFYAAPNYIGRNADICKKKINFAADKYTTMSTTELPHSLQALETYQNAYSQRLRALPYYHIVAPIVEQFLRQAVDYGAFYLRVPVSALEGILQSRSIKSMMETGTGATNGGKQTRQEVTEALFGCDASKLLPEEYPKYGFLSQPDADKDLLVNGGMWCQYGDVSIQLKKERLMHRTTLCVGNSVNFGNCHALIPTRVDNIKATCLCGLPHGEGQAFMAPPDPMSCYVLFATWIVEKKLTLGNFPMIEELARDLPPVFDFFELQYHGPVSLLEDVERIDVAPSSAKEADQLAMLKEKFDAIGVRMNMKAGS